MVQDKSDVICLSTTRGSTAALVFFSAIASLAMSGLAYACFKAAVRGGPQMVPATAVGLIAATAIGGAIYIVVARCVTPYEPDIIEISPSRFRCVCNGQEVSAPWNEVSNAERHTVGAGKYRYDAVRLTVSGEALSLAPSKFNIPVAELIDLITAARLGKTIASEQ